MSPFDDIQRWSALLILMVWMAEWSLLQWRVDRWFLTGFPLILAPTPIARLPWGEGQTQTAAWEVSSHRPVARFWASGHGTLPGLRGGVRFQRRRGDVILDVYWTPPWTLLFAIVWFGLWGVRLGHGFYGVVSAVLVTGAVLLVYRVAARRVAAELRFAWAQLPPRGHSLQGGRPS